MTSFGRYEILDKLGEGAMGVVYRARHTALGRVVALKMLSAEVSGEREVNQRFAREAEAIGRLNHPNVVTVYDVGEAEGRAYMAMELLDGDDLRSIIERRAPLGVADKVRILIQICDGLGYAHSRGVVHRDIKPANILVTTTGKVKILDFGLARVTERETITRKGVILGTPDYMSPEQAMGRPVDPRSDVFSAGAVFYEFLCYEKPFKGKTLHSVLYKIVQEEPDALVTLWPEMPIRLAAVVHWMMPKDPARRYGSMAEVGAALIEIHRALRRTSGRSAHPGATGPAADDVRVRVREHLMRGKAHEEAGRDRDAIADMNAVLALDPGCEDAAEALWRIMRAAREPAGRRSGGGGGNRIDALLQKAAPGRPEPEARSAIAELALIAPDDPRVLELLRLRSGRE